MAKVLQTIQSMNIKSGGPTTCTHDLMEGIYVQSCNVDLMTLQDGCDLSLIAGHDRPWIKLIANDTFSPLFISKNFRKVLAESDYNLYHTNALWLYVNHITCKIAREKHKPYIISPHGMLYPSALKIKVWKKKPMLWLWFNKDIHHAACLHTTCYEEMQHCRTFGYKGPIAVIPNPVVIPNEIVAKKCIPSEKRIGFIGRLHPIKKVEALIYGMAYAIEQGAPSFQLDIMGTGSKDYEIFLRKEVNRLGLDSKVNFVGFVSGKEKYERLSNLWALFVPSVQENFGMIVPEALICGTPVYASKGTPWEELNSHGCGWWHKNSPDTIASIILELFSKNESELLQMGKNGRTLIEQKYEQAKVARQMLRLYEWILNGGNKPEFVYE